MNDDIIAAQANAAGVVTDNTAANAPGGQTGDADMEFATVAAGAGQSTSLPPIDDTKQKHKDKAE